MRGCTTRTINCDHIRSKIVFRSRTYMVQLSLFGGDAIRSTVKQRPTPLSSYTFGSRNYLHCSVTSF